MASKTGASTATDAVDYNAAEILDNGYVHYYHDSYKLNTSSIYVEVNGHRYKQTDIPIASKESASFINAQNSVQELFGGKHLSCMMSDFV